MREVWVQKSLVCKLVTRPALGKVLARKAENIQTKMATETAIYIPFLTDKEEIQEEGTNPYLPITNPLNAADCETDDKGAFDQTDLVPEGKCNQWKEQQHNGAWKAKGKEAQLAEKRAEVEKQIGAMISTVQAHIENLVEAEKRKSEQYLSLARKYYTMWKALNDERSRRHRTLNKKKITPRRRDSTNAVSFSV